jgi:glycosyltransferase involved in cell wall biosynthesis
MSSTNKKLMILIDWFAPGYKAGGPIQSCVNICKALQQQFDIYVLTTNTDHGEAQPYAGIIANTWQYNEQLNVHLFYADKATLSTAIIKQQIKQVNADIVYLNLLFSPFFALYPLWLVLTGQLKKKVVLCPRGTLYQSGLNIKAYKKKPVLFLLRLFGLSKKIIFHASNQREQLAIQQYFPNAHVCLANNLPSFNQQPFASCNKKAGELNIVFIARVVPIKNLLFLIQILEKVKQQVCFTIAGPLEDAAYWTQCEAAINKLPANIVVNYAGPVHNSMVQNILQNNHLFALPTLGENFGHSIFEALQAGRPVLISNQTPWHNLAIQQAGWDLPLSNQLAFVNAIGLLADADQQTFNQYALSAWQYANQFLQQQQHSAAYTKMFL